MENINAYKALAFFDLDGTLLNEQSQLDKEVVAAVHEIRKNGILPFLATGRGHFDLDKIMEETGITGAVTMNGQYIILDGKTIYRDPISMPHIEKLHRLAVEQDEVLAFYGKDGYWVDRHTNFLQEIYSYSNRPLPEINPEGYKTEEVNMLLLLTDKLSQVDYYKMHVPELNFFMNSPTSIDVTNISTNKGTGITRVKEMLNFKGETYAFGDGRNDLHLLEAADYGTAMGNAIPELKDIADFISSKNTEHGIVNAFKHWNFI